jgi:hypothetical protein
MTKSEEQERPNPAPLTVTHAPAARLESGEILSSPEDYERHAVAQAEPSEQLEIEEGLSDG